MISFLVSSMLGSGSVSLGLPLGEGPGSWGV
jgi:hypothetical protein